MELLHWKDVKLVRLLGIVPLDRVIQVRTFAKVRLHRGDVEMQLIVEHIAKLPQVLLIGLKRKGYKFRLVAILNN